jgi:hypothetical protein
VFTNHVLFSENIFIIILYHWRRTNLRLGFLMRIWYENYFWLSLTCSVPALEFPFNLISLIILCRSYEPCSSLCCNYLQKIWELTVILYPTTFCGTFPHEKTFRFVTERFCFCCTRQQMGPSWCHTRTLPRCFLILKCHVSYSTHIDVIVNIRKRNTVLFGANFYENNKYPTVLCAEFYTEFYPHLQLNIQSRHRN